MSLVRLALGVALVLGSLEVASAQDRKGISQWVDEGTPLGDAKAPALAPARPAPFKPEGPGLAPAEPAPVNPRGPGFVAKPAPAPPSFLGDPEDLAERRTERSRVDRARELLDRSEKATNPGVRQRQREEARALLRQARDGGTEAERKAARELLRRMARVPIINQHRMGTDLFRDPVTAPKHRRRDYGRGLCGVASLGMIAKNERGTWSNRDAEGTAFGSDKARGAYRVDKNGNGQGSDRNLLANVARLVYGLDATVHNAELRRGENTARLRQRLLEETRRQIDEGRPVVIMGTGLLAPTAEETPGGMRPTLYRRSFPNGHYMVIDGYKDPKDQTAEERKRANGQRIYYVVDPNTGKRFEVPEDVAARYVTSPSGGIMTFGS